MDGRGGLTEKGLINFCEYMLDIGIDQAKYASDLLDVNSFQKRLKGYMQARKYGRAQAIELTGMEQGTARRLISQLKREGMLSEKNNKSPLKWEVPEHIEPWYFPGLSN